MPEKIEIPYDVKFKETVNTLADCGLLLVSQGNDGKPNAMTIGKVTGRTQIAGFSS